MHLLVISKDQEIHQQIELILKEQSQYMAKHSTGDSLDQAMDLISYFDDLDLIFIGACKYSEHKLIESIRKLSNASIIYLSTTNHINQPAIKSGANIIIPEPFKKEKLTKALASVNNGTAYKQHLVI